MQCEVCGANTDYELKSVLIEGVVMKVCLRCETLGTPINRGRPSNLGNSFQRRVSHNPRLVPEEEVEITLRPEYGLLIKKKREDLGIKQEDLAKMISEKESLVHKIESTSPVINVLTARKIEKILKLKILEEGNDSAGPSEKHARGEAMTLGDLIKQKMK